MKKLRDIKLQQPFTLELYLEDLESIYFKSEDVRLSRITYRGKNELAYIYTEDGEKEVEEYNIYIDRIELIIYASARNSYLETGQDKMPKIDNFERILDQMDVVGIYFRYEDDTFFCAETPFDGEATGNQEKSNCKYYLDDEDNLHIELVRKGA